MSSFTRAVMVAIPDAYTDGRQLFVAVDGYRWYLGFVGSGRWVDVPAGFITDRVSFPPKWLRDILTTFMPPLWTWLQAILETMATAAGVHDRMREDAKEFSLIESDATFLMCMECAKVWPPAREIAFLAVRNNKSRTSRQEALSALVRNQNSRD